MTNGTARTQVFVGAGQWTSSKKSGALFRQTGGSDAWEHAANVCHALKSISLLKELGKFPSVIVTGPNRA